MKKIKLTRGKFALVDNEDFEYLNQWKWHCTSTGYAARKRHVHDAKLKYHGVVIFMHRLIMSTPEGMDTDHINSNSLDNRRSNLRICTHAENLRNKRIQKNNKSGYKGVYWDKFRDKWRVEIRLNGKHMSGGRYDNILDAARAYDRKAKKLFGEYAGGNFK